jgi:FMN phosphatase YigB (HAD superfamily)
MELKILIVEPNPEIAEIFRKNFAEQFGAIVTLYSDAKTALRSLTDLQSSYSLFIVRNLNIHAEEEIAVLFLNHIYDFSLKTPLIVIGEFEHAYKKYAYISEKMRIEELNRLTLKALGLKKEDFKNVKLPEYIAYPLRFFYLLNAFPTTVCMKLVKKAGDEYVCHFKAGDEFNTEGLEKYAEVGLTEFYVPKEENEVFMNAIILQGLTAIKKASTLEENIQATEQTFIISAELMKGLGINSTATLLVDQTLQIMRAQVTKPDQLAQLLKKLLDNQMSYSYRRSYLICVLSNALFPKMEWGSGEQQQIILTKLSMISYFHDIFLSDEKLLKIMNHKDFKNADLTTDERDLVLNHANRAALLVQSYPRLPQGVDVIIKQHHGVTNGVGFPEQYTIAISPMAIFFIVVEDFATQLLSLNPGDKIHTIVQVLKERYQLPSYKKIVNEIEAMVIK